MNGGFAQKSARRHGEAGKGQSDLVHILHVVAIEPRKLVVVHVKRAARVHLVSDYVEFGFQDHSKQAIATQHVAKQISVFRRAGLHGFAAGEHDAQPAHRRRDRTRLGIDAVGILQTFRQAVASLQSDQPPPAKIINARRR